MPSPWVRRAQGTERAADGTALRLPPKVLNGVQRANYGRGDGLGIADRIHIRADERTASAVSDSHNIGQGGSSASDPADAYGTVRALRAFGIVR